MPRHSKVYVVSEGFLTEDGDYDHSLLAAFTVKREMIVWLRDFSVFFPERFGELFIEVSPDRPTLNEWGDSSFVQYDETPADLLLR